MTVESGQYGRISKDASGTITGVRECTKWTFKKAASKHLYGSCATGGYKRTITGTQTVDGTLEGMYERDTPIEDSFDVGDRVLLQLHTDATAGHKFWVKIIDIGYDMDMDDGSPPKWTASYSMDDDSPSFNTTLTAIP